MKEWFGGKGGGAAAFVVIFGLVAGGLGWATAAALRLESEQLTARAEAEQADRMRLALWRLDSYVAPLTAVEDSRPFNHYSAVFAAPFAFDNHGAARPPGAVVEPSPLLNADLPDWMLLHFQLDASGWESPQAPSDDLKRVLRNPPTLLANVTPGRTALLDELKGRLKPGELIATIRERVSPTMHLDTVLLPAKHPSDYAANGNRDGQNQTPAPNNDFQMRLQNNPLNNSAPAQLYDRSVALNGLEHNGENWLSFKGARGVPGAEVPVNLSPMTAVWAPTGNGRERLLLVRLVRVEEKEVCQGVVLDDAALGGLLADKVADLFPDARLLPVYEPDPMQPDRTMTALPLLLDPGPAPPPPNPGWTPLRVGLALAWTAALVALLAVGLGGWSLIDLSQRRIRFVSAVTHELRTPLTTLRLYLDMLMNGLVRRPEATGGVHPHAQRGGRTSEPAGGQRARLLAVGKPTSTPQPGAGIADRLARPDGRGVAESVPKRRQGTGDRATDGRDAGSLYRRRTGAAGAGRPARQRLQAQPGRGRPPRLASRPIRGPAYGVRGRGSRAGRAQQRMPVDFPGLPPRPHGRRDRGRRRAGAGAGPALGAAVGRRIVVALHGGRGVLPAAPAFAKVRSRPDAG